MHDMVAPMQVGASARSVRDGQSWGADSASVHMLLAQVVQLA
jgi:hypothetical protein